MTVLDTAAHVVWVLAEIWFCALLVFVALLIVGSLLHDHRARRAQQRADVERARYLARQFFAATEWQHWTPADDTAALAAYLRSTP